MNIKVQRQKPNRGEGAQGEMRLIIMARGAWLYVKGGNQWHALVLNPSEEADQSARRRRGDLQRNIQKVADSTWANGDGEHESILNPGGGKISQAAHPDAPL